MAAFGFRKNRGRRSDRSFDEFSGDGLTGDVEQKLDALSSGSAGRELDELKERVARLSLTVKAIWSLVKEQTELDEDALRERMAALKSEEGETCPTCGRIMSRRHQRCLYCGTRGGPGSVMDDL